jgi:cytochrome c-type biogenesis protein CcmH/NrfG
LNIFNCCSELIRTDPNNADALYLRGVAMLYTANVTGAIKHFATALRLDPDNSTYRTELKVRGTV